MTEVRLDEPDWSCDDIIILSGGCKLQLGGVPVNSRQEPKSAAYHWKLVI